MSTTPDPTAAATATTSTVTPEPAEAAAVETPAQESTDWKAEARKWEARAKENKEAAEKLAEIEEASKSEQQKQAEALAAAQARIAEFEQAAQVASWTQEVAEATGVPASALRGSTKEEIEAHATTLKALIAEPEKQPEKQRPVPTIGKVPATQPNIPIGDQIAAAEKAGDITLASELKALLLSAS